MKRQKGGILYGIKLDAREDGIKDHDRYGIRALGNTGNACTIYEKRPLKDPKGNVIPGLHVAWIS